MLNFFSLVNIDGEVREIGSTEQSVDYDKQGREKELRVQIRTFRDGSESEIVIKHLTPGDDEIGNFVIIVADILMQHE